MEVCTGKNMTYTDVKGGDIYRDNILPSYGYYIVCIENGNKHLHSLDHGGIWNSNSLFGSQGREGFTKVNACLKIED